MNEFLCRLRGHLDGLQITVSLDRKGSHRFAGLSYAISYAFCPVGLDPDDDRGRDVGIVARAN